MHKFTRYCFSHEDIENLSRITGFKIVRDKEGKEYHREPLPAQDAEGNELGDENLYYVLEKI